MERVAGDEHLLVLVRAPTVQEWAKAGVFAAFWRDGLLAYDGLVGINLNWLALDGAMRKAPLGGGKPAPFSGLRQARVQAFRAY